MDSIFPQWTYQLPGVRVGIDQTILVAIAAVTGVALMGFFRFSRLGLYTRAVVGDPELAELKRLNSAGITRFSWMLGSSFAALAGVLLTPTLGLDSIVLTGLVIQAFAAAVIGKLTSIPRTYLGAVFLGVAASLATKMVAAKPALSGLPNSLPFFVLFGMLVFSPKGSFPEIIKSVATQVRTGVTRTGAPRFPLRTLVGAIALAAVAPAFLNGSQLFTATSVLAFVLIFASLSLLLGLSRQISLAHAVFVVFGATTLSHLQEAGVPYLVALLVAGLIVLPVGALLALPAVRLSGLFLALATFGFGVLAQSLLFGTELMFGAAGIVRIERPELFGISLGDDKAFYYFVLAVVVLGVVAVETVRITRLGRVLRALGDSVPAIESLGINPVVSRVLIFCLAAFLGAIAGGLEGTLITSVNPLSFSFFQSLLWVTVLVTGGLASLGGSIVAAVLLVALPSIFTSPRVLEWLPVGFGMAAILLAQAPNGLAGLVRAPDVAGLARASTWRLDNLRGRERLAEAVR
jgi:ABC-type branched-subunit amino acid transport system permease subunit